jgi:uncharacterized protein
VSTRVLRVAPGVQIPADQFIESATALIGKRGSGKSGGVKVIEEELFHVGLPFITLDPVGIHYGIRSSYDGSAPGLPVMVIGGLHGDLRLDRRAGGEIARAVMEANVSCVIDFSEEPKSAYREFVRDFAKELYSKNSTPRVVIIEEAPELVPQRFRPDMAETYEAVERLVSRGRNKGLGVVLVSQRAATINKDVLTQVDNLLVGRLVSPQDRKALGEWVEAWDAKDKLPEFEAGLASLPTRTMWLWSPETLKEFRPIRFKDFHTLHGDRTHLNRLHVLTTKPVTTDVSSVVAKLGQELARFSKEKTDTNRLPGLEREVSRLKAELEKAKAAPAATLARIVEKRVVDERAVERAVRENDQRWASWAKKLVAYSNTLQEKAAALPGILTAMPPGWTPPTVETKFAPVTPQFFRGGEAISRETWPPKEKEDNGGEVQIKAGARRMLAELASRHPMVLTRAQLATLAGFTASGGTYTTYLSILKRAGYLTEDATGNVVVTQAGMDFIGEVPAAPSTHEEVMARWGHSLKAGCFRMLREIVSAYPDPLSKSELAERIQFAESGGTFSTYLSILARNGLIEKQGDSVVASKNLYP